MGVHGLWQVLEPTGKPVALETLDNKILAVDVSLWLHQAVKGFRDSQGGPIANAHLIGMFHRVCKLLFYGIKPVFVFDGGVPQLKKQTLAARQQRRTVAQEGARRKARLLLLAARHKGKVLARRVPAHLEEDIFALPPLPPEWDKLYRGEEEEEEEWSTYEHFPTELSSLDPDQLSELPAAVRHEVLTAMQRHQRWGPRVQLPQDSESFSSYQVTQLLRKRRLQQEADRAHQEMRRSRGQLLLWEPQDLAEVEKLQEDKRPTQEEHQPHDTPALQEECRPPGKHSLQNEQLLHIECLLHDQHELEGRQPPQKWSLRDNQKTQQEGCLSEEELQVQHLLWTEAALQKEPSLQEAHALNTDSPLQEEHSSQDVVLLEGVSTQNSCSSLPASNCVYLASPPLEGPHSAITQQVVPDLGQQIRSTPLECATAKHCPVKVVTIDVMNDPGLPCRPFREEQTIEEDLIKEDNIDTVQEPEQPSQPCKKDLAAKDSPKKKEIVDATHDPGQPFQPCKEVLALKDSLQMQTNDTSDDPGQSSQPCKEKLAVKNSPNKKETNDAAGDLGNSSQPFKEELAVKSSPNKKETNDAAGDSGLPLQSHGEEEEEGPSTSQKSYWKPVGEWQDLEADEQKQQRQSAAISDQAVKECQELLRLFGMPFLVSPGEAEAQCAWLDEQGLTHGTVTDDSDAWLFGAQRVYRHFFVTDRRPTLFRAQDMATQFGLDRQKLVAFALLCGSDYTPGVNGVGPITAMEVLSEFSGEDAVDLLQSFRSWLAQAQRGEVRPGSRTKSHLVRLTLDPGFPSPVVARAYLEPTVDASRESFSWGTPDLDGLRRYGQQKLGWAKEKLDDLLLPVLRRMGQKQRQTRMDQYLEACQAPRKPNLFPSKRLCKAVGKMADRPMLRVEPHLSEDSDESD